MAQSSVTNCDKITLLLQRTTKALGPYSNDIILINSIAKDFYRYQTSFVHQVMQDFLAITDVTGVIQSIHRGPGN